MKPHIQISLLALATASSASAALFAYEGFDNSFYNEGSSFANNISGQGTGSGSGFSGVWETPTLNSASSVYFSTTGGSATAANYLRADPGQASYGSLTTTAGQAAYETTSSTFHRVSLQRDFSTPVSPSPESFFVSTLVGIDGSSGVSLSFGAVLNGGQAGSRPFQFGFQQDGTLFARGNSVFSEGGNNTTVQTIASGSSFTPGTYFVLAQIMNGPSGATTTQDAINVWINPSLSGPLGTPDVTLDHNTAASTTTNFYVGTTSGWGAAGVVLDFYGNGPTAGTTTVDEIRIGDTFSDVALVPEPSSALLSLLGLSALVMRRKR